MKRYLMLLAVLVMVAGCGGAATATPDAVATQVAVMEAAAATLTAAAPSVTASALPSATSTQIPSPSPTALPIATATVEPSAAPTSTPTPSPIPPTVTPLPPTATTRPPTATPPPIGPVLGQFAVAGIYSNDVLNVRAGPGTGQRVVATIPYFGRDVQVHTGGIKVGSSWWVPVTYESVTGWSNNSYLARQVGNTSDALAAAAARAVLALRDRDLELLVGLVHPVKGVTFSPYTFVRPLQGAPGEADLVFSREQLRAAWTDPSVLHWGYFSGSGAPIDLTFEKYYGDFVYDADFGQPDAVGFGEIIGKGNTINNIAEVYPLGVAIEYHFEGFDPQYGGMDWRSLRLVFEEVDGAWFLVGIVHDEWTP